MNTKVTVLEIKKLSVKEYLNKIIPYLKDIINNLKKSDAWKVQLTIANNFTSSIYNDEDHLMHSKSGNITLVMINIVIKSRLMLKQMKLEKNFLIHFDQNNLESMKGSEFVFNYIHLLFNKCHQIIPNHG